MKKGNNRGFSLIELLIAVVILGIITAPLLHTFVSAARVSVKSRQAGDATTAAQNAVEVIQAASVNQVLGAEADALEDLFGADAAYPAADGSLLLAGVSSGDRDFDLRVTLDPGAYQAADDVSGVNDQLITQYTSMEAVYTQKPGNLENPDTLAEEAFAAAYTDGVITNRSRLTTIEITSAAAEGGENIVQISLTFRYTFRYEYEETGPEGTVVRRDTYTHEVPVTTLLPLSYKVPAGQSVSAYVFFYPYYAGNIGAYNETIAIQNLNNQPCKLFLVKQKAAGGTSSDESGYRAMVTLNELHDGSEFYTSLFTNMSANLYTAGESLGSNVTYRKYYTRGGLMHVAGDLSSTALVEQLAEDRLYDVTVEVYPAGSIDGSDPAAPSVAGSALLSFAATKLQ